MTPKENETAAPMREYAAAVYGNFKEKTPLQRGAALLFAALFAVRAFVIATFPLDAVTERPASCVVTDRYGAPLRGELSDDGEYRLPVALSDMGEWLPVVVVALEDRRFYWHNGADTFAILRAAYQNFASRRVVSGASTIASQTVRLAVERPRNVPSKLAEFAQGAALEYFMSKDKILETYLNNVPLGGNVRGAEAASRLWFGKSAKELSLAEAALLAVLLRGPAYYSPTAHASRALALRDRELDALARRGVITKEQAYRAKKEKLPSKKIAISSKEIQAANAALKYGGGKGALNEYGRFRSTLDPAAQELLKRELSAALLGSERGVTAAAVLVENETRKVRGYVGNAREGESSDASWVDCAGSFRSPGSALKPFIYALAFEEGRITPGSLLADLPLHASGAGARNFDRLFRGPVTARAALADSLNAPAVRVLRTVGAANALDLYRRLGFSRFTKDASWYGDSIALGGCEVSPVELARAYCAVANGGAIAPLTWNEFSKKEAGSQVISESAAALVLDILKDARRNLPQYTDAASDGKTIAFKTGTSYGLRDAWAAAVTKKYTLVVWFGDPSGKAHRSLVGLKSAAPAAMRAMLKLTGKGEPWFSLPPNVVKKELCALSGALPNQYCPSVKRDFVIEGVSSAETCTLHILRGGETAVRWNDEFENYFAKRKSAGAKSRLVITSPKDGATYRLAGGGGKIPLAAEGGDGVVYWFADGEFIGDETDAPINLELRAGPHTIAAANERGETDEVKISVKGAGTQNENNTPLLEETDY